MDSAEQIVYDRLLQRLAHTGDIVELQQVSLLPIKEEEFNDLAAGVLSSNELEKRSRERIALQKSRTQSMEIPAQDLHNIYPSHGRDRQERDVARHPRRHLKLHFKRRLREGPGRRRFLRQLPPIFNGGWRASPMERP